MGWGPCLFFDFVYVHTFERDVKLIHTSDCSLFHVLTGVNRFSYLSLMATITTCFPKGSLEICEVVRTEEAFGGVCGRCGIVMERPDVLTHDNADKLPKVSGIYIFRVLQYSQTLLSASFV